MLRPLTPASATFARCFVRIPNPGRVSMDMIRFEQRGQAEHGRKAASFGDLKTHFTSRCLSMWSSPL